MEHEAGDEELVDLDLLRDAEREAEFAIDPEGAFIHPNDLEEEMEDDRFQEPVIWPGALSALDPFLFLNIFAGGPKPQFAASRDAQG